MYCIKYMYIPVHDKMCLAHNNSSNSILKFLLFLAILGLVCFPHQGFKFKVGKIFKFLWRTNRIFLDILAIRSHTIGFQKARPEPCFFYQRYNDSIELYHVKKSANSQTPLAEQPVHLGYQAKWASKWLNVFLLRWYFLYRLFSRRTTQSDLSTAGQGEQRRWVRGWMALYALKHLKHDIIISPKNVRCN